MMKNLLLLIPFALLAFTSSAQINANLSAPGCMKQVNVDPVWDSTETVLIVPEQKVQVTPPVYETVTQTIVVKEAATRKFFKCDASGAISICSEDIPAVTETITYKIEVSPATFTTTPAEVIKYVLTTKVKDGYIGYVPCNN